jgi:hypothetical protein
MKRNFIKKINKEKGVKLVLNPDCVQVRSDIILIKEGKEVIIYARENSEMFKFLTA